MFKTDQYFITVTGILFKRGEERLIRESIIHQWTTESQMVNRLALNPYSLNLSMKLEL